MYKLMKIGPFHGMRLVGVVGYPSRILQSIAEGTDVQFQRQLDQPKMMLLPLVIYLVHQFQHQNQFERVIQRRPNQ